MTLFVSAESATIGAEFSDFESSSDYHRLCVDEGGDLADAQRSSRAGVDCAVFDFVLYTLVGGSLCVFGVVGNILSFIVLQLQPATEGGAASAATTLLLRALAVADSLVLVVAVPLYALTPVRDFIKTSATTTATTTTSNSTVFLTALFSAYYDLYPKIMPYLWPLYQIPYTATVLLTVLVSVDRYAAVCRPFSTASKLRSGARSFRQVVYVTLFAIVYNIPRFFEYQTVAISDGGGREQITDADSTNGTGIGNKTDDVSNVDDQPFELSAVGENKFYRILYANILYFIVMLGGPLVLLAFLNSRLIIALKAQDRKRKLMSGNGRKCVVSSTATSNPQSSNPKSNHHQQQQQQQKDLTLMLVVVVFVFMLCQTPTFVDHVLWTVVAKGQTTCGHWHYYYTAVGDVLAILNSSVNFVVYIVASPKFRRGLIALLCGRCGSSSSSSSSCCVRARGSDVVAGELVATGDEAERRRLTSAASEYRRPNVGTQCLNKGDPVDSRRRSFFGRFGGCWQREQSKGSDDGNLTAEVDANLDDVGTLLTTAVNTPSGCGELIEPLENVDIKL